MSRSHTGRRTETLITNVKRSRSSEALPRRESNSRPNHRTCFQATLPAPHSNQKSR